MQITSVTNTNYIGNPGFTNDTVGWSVAGGNLSQNPLLGYNSTVCGQLTPTSNYGFIEYDVTALTPNLPYVGQARVLAGAGQQVFISFADGSGLQTYIASGNWDLLTTGTVVQPTANFGLIIGYGSELLINVSEHAATSETFSVQEGIFGIGNLSIQDSTTTYETYQIVTSGGWLFNSTIFGPNLSDTVTTSEKFSIQVVGQGAYISGNTYFITVSEASAIYENSYVSIDVTTDKNINIDAVQLEQSTSASPYFDGNSGQGYHWYGTAGSSQSYYRQFEVAQGALSNIPQWEVLISWTKALNSNYSFFTIGSSTIGGADFIAGASTGFPTYFNQYQYNDYAQYLLSASVTRSIGQYPYGAFGGQLNMLLDNSNYQFLPGFDPTIGSFIISRRPIEYAVAFNGEAINLFSGSTTKPSNDIQNRTLAITAFDGMDFLNSFISQGAGPVALANNGNYVNLPAQTIISDLLQEAGFSSTQFVLEQSLQSNIGYLCPTTYQSQSSSGAVGSVGSILYDICQAEQALFFFDESGVGHFWNREHIPTNNTINWAFSYSDIMNFQTEDTPIINDVTVIAQPRVVQSLQNIWQLTSATIVPPASTSQIIQNIAVNGNFITATGGFYNSGYIISAQENINTSEFIQQYMNETALFHINDSTQTSEQITVFISSLNKLFMSDSTSLSEVISVKVGSNPSYVTPLNITVTDSTVTGESLYMNGRVSSAKELVLENAVTSETINVQIISAARTAPYIQENVKVYESYNISSQTITGWGVQNATLYQNAYGPIVNNSGQITTTGGSTSYLFQQYNCTVSTQYATQCQVKGFPSTTVTMAAVQNGVVLSSQTITLDGNWDTVVVPPFITNPTNTTFQIQIYSQGAATFNVGAVMTQLGVGALTTYYDGSSTTTPNYRFTWTGTPYVSFSNASPVGSAVIVASFQDDNGSLPVTGVDLPLYNNANLDSSYLTNLNQDGSGITGNTYISLQGAVLNGSTYTMTFINTYTQPVYITACTLFGTPAKVVYSINQEYKDPTSISLYGTNPTNNGQALVITNNLIQDPSTALSDAYSLVNDYSKPYQRMTADVFPAYMLQIGDNVNMTINDTGQTQTYTVVGTTNGVSNDGGPIQSLEVEVKNLVHYFTINQSVIGGLDSIAP